jgi:hypothetical protein
MSQPQLAWLGSIANRVTGTGLSVRTSPSQTILSLNILRCGRYSPSLAYLAAPGTFDSTTIVEFVAGLPDAVTFPSWTFADHPFFPSLEPQGSVCTKRPCVRMPVSELGTQDLSINDHDPKHGMSLLSLVFFTNKCFLVELSHQ